MFDRDYGGDQSDDVRRLALDVRNAQIELVTTIVDANDLLEAVRGVQHESRAVPKATLMQDAGGSVTKSCQPIGQPDRLVADLVVQL